MSEAWLTEQLWASRMHTEPWRCLNARTQTRIETKMCIHTHLLTLSFTQTKLWAAMTSGFCIVEPEDGRYNPGFHIDTQQSSADFCGSCCVQHFPLPTLSSSKSPWQRTCLYSLLCQNRHYKKSCLYFLAVNNFHSTTNLCRQKWGLFWSVFYDLLSCVSHCLPWKCCLYHYN